jgi:hypothetical protein
MEDMTISATATLAYVLWAAGITLVLLQLVGVVPVGQLGLVAIAAAAVLNIRGFLAEQYRRERAAFNLGRESVRSVR